MAVKSDRHAGRLCGVRLWLTFTGVLLTAGCARPVPGAAPAAASVSPLARTTTPGSACTLDDTARGLQQRVRNGELSARRVALQCVATANGRVGPEVVAEALDVLVTRLEFLGAPEDRMEQTGDTVYAWVPLTDTLDFNRVTRRGALSVHEVDEAALRAMQPQPLSGAATALGVQWETWLNALVVPEGVSVEALTAVMPTAGAGLGWSLVRHYPGIHLGLLVHPLALDAGDVLPCAAREVEDEFPRVRIGFTPVGARRLADLTERAVGGRVVIVLDGVGLMAPTVQEPIRGGEIDITRTTMDLDRVQLAVLQRVLPEGVQCAYVSLQ